MNVPSYLVQALFDHRNVLSLIGVITAPRDMPTLLVLAYCDNGSLLNHVQAQGKEINASTKLTFCAEVAQGMEYIASRRVVSTGFFKTLVPRNSSSQSGVYFGSRFWVYLFQIHRDVAARNILLDTMLICKVGE